jgi:hypothetical protein
MIITLDPAAPAAPILELRYGHSLVRRTKAASHCFVQRAIDAIDDDSHGARRRRFGLMPARDAPKHVRKTLRIIHQWIGIHAVLVDNRRTRRVGDI